MLPSLGIADPHAHVWPGDPDTVFVYATHDCSPSGRGNCTASRGLGFRMDDWCVPPSRESCVESRMQAQADRRERPGPRPFSDPIGKALVPEGLVPSYSRDPCVFREGDDYYLIWGTSFIDAATLENTSFASGGGTADRHGSFFAFHNQTYFACNDRSHGGGSGYRNTIVNYVHYAANGSIAPLRIDEVGVGAFDVAASPRVEAENYFSASAPRRETAAAAPWTSGGRRAYNAVRNVPRARRCGSSARATRSSRWRRTAPKSARAASARRAVRSRPATWPCSTSPRSAGPGRWTRSKLLKPPRG
ncbi:hypothetical protein JL720_14093 [Aureococcus anophagefferens]|nr:hypothetical protein JL720_14093 [Aureococcus anophagefferens]